MFFKGCFHGGGRCRFSLEIGFFMWNKFFLESAQIFSQGNWFYFKVRVREVKVIPREDKVIYFIFFIRNLKFFRERVKNFQKGIIFVSMRLNFFKGGCDFFWRNEAVLGDWDFLRIAKIVSGG